MFSQGLSLSGCEQEATNNELKEGLIKKYPDLSKKYHVCSDTIAPIATVCDRGWLLTSFICLFSIATEWYCASAHFNLYLICGRIKVYL